MSFSNKFKTCVGIICLLLSISESLAADANFGILRLNESKGGARNEVSQKNARAFLFSKAADKELIRNNTIFVGEASSARILIDEELGGGVLELEENTIVTVQFVNATQSPQVKVQSGTVKFSPSSSPSTSKVDKVFFKIIPPGESQAIEVSGQSKELVVSMQQKISTPPSAAPPATPILTPTPSVPALPPAIPAPPKALPTPVVRPTKVMTRKKSDEAYVPPPRPPSPPPIKIPLIAVKKSAGIEFQYVLGLGLNISNFLEGGHNYFNIGSGQVDFHARAFALDYNFNFDIRGGATFLNFGNSNNSNYEWLGAGSVYYVLPSMFNHWNFEIEGGYYWQGAKITGDNADYTNRYGGPVLGLRSRTNFDRDELSLGLRASLIQDRFSIQSLTSRELSFYAEYFFGDYELMNQPVHPGLRLDLKTLSLEKNNVRIDRDSLALCLVVDY